MGFIIRKETGEQFKDIYLINKIGKFNTQNLVGNILKSGNNKINAIHNEYDSNIRMKIFEFFKKEFLIVENWRNLSAFY